MNENAKPRVLGGAATDGMERVTVYASQCTTPCLTRQRPATRIIEPMLAMAFKRGDLPVADALLLLWRRWRAREAGR